MTSPSSRRSHLHRGLMSEHLMQVLERQVGVALSSERLTSGMPLTVYLSTAIEPALLCRLG